MSGIVRPDVVEREVQPARLYGVNKARTLELFHLEAGEGLAAAPAPSEVVRGRARGRASE